MTHSTNTQGLIQRLARRALASRQVTQNVPMRKGNGEHRAAVATLDRADSNSLTAFRAGVRTSCVQARCRFRLSDRNLKSMLALETRVRRLHRRLPVCPMCRLSPGRSFETFVTAGGDGAVPNPLRHLRTRFVDGQLSNVPTCDAETLSGARTPRSWGLMTTSGERIQAGRLDRIDPSLLAVRDY